jgi:DNA-binding beta-propeller fold protein YncE
MGPAIAATLNAPAGLASDTAGNLYVADNAANVVRVILPDGTISAFAGTGTAGETGDGGPATAARLNQCRRLAIDSSGNLYITDFIGNTVRVVTPDGIIHTIASGATFPNGISSDNLADGGSFGGDGGPAIGAHYEALGNVAFDGSGNIFLADTENARIRVLRPNQ